MSSIVTEPETTTQLDGTGIYETQSSESKTLNEKVITKAILFGAAMIGIGIAASAVLGVFGIAGMAGAIASGAITGFVSPYVNAQIGAAVEHKSITEYGKT